jgi:hypothetical protein
MGGAQRLAGGDRAGERGASQERGPDAPEEDQRACDDGEVKEGEVGDVVLMEGHGVCVAPAWDGTLRWAGLASASALAGDVRETEAPLHVV